MRCLLEFAERSWNILGIENEHAVGISRRHEGLTCWPECNQKQSKGPALTSNDFWLSCYADELRSAFDSPRMRKQFLPSITWQRQIPEIYGQRFCVVAPLLVKMKIPCFKPWRVLLLTCQRAGYLHSNGSFRWSSIKISSNALLSCDGV